MQISKIKSIIKQGEGMHVEFKECRDKLSKEVFETVCAFLNRFGGELLLGVNDASKIIGINKEKEIGHADELGSGVKKLFKYCKIYSGSDPELIEEDIFKTIIPLGWKTEAKTGGIKGGAKGGIKGGVKLSNRQKEIVVNMQKNPTITYNELAEKLKINPSAIQKHIKKLKKKKVIKRMGDKRGGYWKIIGEG